MKVTKAGAATAIVFMTCCVFVGWSTVGCPEAKGVWQRQDSGTEADLNAVWGTTSPNLLVVAVGDRGTRLGYDGRRWRSLVPKAPVEIDGGGSVDGGEEEGEGTEAAPGPEVTADLFGVWGNSATDIYAVGEEGIILHYDGEDWRRLPSGTTADLYAVWGVVGEILLASGENGTILAYNWVDWHAMANPLSSSEATITAIWGREPELVWAVATGQGTVLRYDGAWSEVEVGAFWKTSDPSGCGSGGDGDPPPELECGVFKQVPLFDIWGTGGADVFATGMSGTILHHDGVSWDPLETETTVTLNAIWGTEFANLYAIGDRGVILRFDGVTWTSQASPTTKPLQDIWGASDGSLALAVGLDGTILMRQ